jgi:hypothetical protein
MPTFHFFKNGKRCDEVRGASRQNLEDTVRRHYVEVELPEDDKPMEKKSCCDKEHNNVRQRKPLVTMIQSHEQWKEVHEKSKSTGKAVGNRHRNATIILYLTFFLSIANCGFYCQMVWPLSTYCTFL